jgi:hypothetical protein
LPGVSSRINGLQGPKSLTNITYIDKKDEEAKKLQSRTYWREMKPDHDPMTHQHAQARSQQKEKDNISETQSKRNISQKKSIYNEYKSPD